MSKELVEEIYQEIQVRNEKPGPRSVVHSDDFLKYITASTGVEPELVKKIIQVLIDSHMIFSIEIVAEDKLRNIPRVEGYVKTDIEIIRKLKNYFQAELVREYEHQFHKNLMVHQIVKEIFPMLKSYNNTSIGQIANKAIMLEEYERLLEKEFVNYTDDWKQERLLREMEVENLHRPLVEKERTAGISSLDDKNQRAVDSRVYVDFISKSKSYPLNRILKIYGLRFFLQVNLRKYQFAYIEKVVKDRQIQKRSDLLMLQDMIRTIKKNIGRDENLDKYLEDLYGLERTLAHRLYFTSKLS